jgi:hypothetical protein
VHNCTNSRPRHSVASYKKASCQERLLRPRAPSVSTRSSSRSASAVWSRGAAKKTLAGINEFAGPETLLLIWRGRRGCRLRGRHIRPMRRKESPRAESPAALRYLCGPLTHTVGRRRFRSRCGYEELRSAQLKLFLRLRRAVATRNRPPRPLPTEAGSMPPSCCGIVVFDMRTWLPEEALKGFREAGRRGTVATTPRRRAHRNRIPGSRIGLCSMG